jgi:hypothetical protein
LHLSKNSISFKIWVWKSLVFGSGKNLPLDFLHLRFKKGSLPVQYKKKSVSILDSGSFSSCFRFVDSISVRPLLYYTESPFFYDSSNNFNLPSNCQSGQTVICSCSLQNHPLLRALYPSDRLCSMQNFLFFMTLQTIKLSRQTFRAVRRLYTLRQTIKRSDGVYLGF